MLQIDYDILRFIAPPKGYAKKTTLAELDPDGRYERWWDNAIDQLVQDFNKTQPKGDLNAWRLYLRTFLIEALSEVGVDILAADDDDDEKIDPKKIEFFTLLIEPLLEKVHTQFETIEKVRANWRYNANKSFLENVSAYASHPEFLSKNTGDSTRGYDFLHSFLGTKDTRPFLPITEKNYKAFHKLASYWKKLSPQFVKAQQDAKIGEDDDLTAISTDINRLDPTQQFRKISADFIKDLDAFYYQVTPSGQYLIECVLDMLFPGEKGSIEMYAREAPLLRTSGIAIFCQWLVEDINATPRYRELQAIQEPKRTASQRAEFEEYAQQSHFLNTLFAQMQKITPNAYAKKPSPYVIIQQLIDGFNIDSIEQQDDIEVWGKNLIAAFAEYLHTVGDESGGKFLIQVAIDGAFERPATKHGYEHYNQHYPRFYGQVLTAFTQQFLLKNVPNDSVVSEKLLKYKDEYQRELATNVTSLVRTQKEGLVEKLSKISDAARVDPLVAVLQKHHHVIDQIDTRSRHYVSEFYRHPRLYSPHDYNELNGLVKKCITQEATEVLETTKDPSIVRSIVQCYKKFTAMVSKLFDFIKKDEEKIIAEAFGRVALEPIENQDVLTQNTAVFRARLSQ